MTAGRGWSLPEHLALDALVAFVDGELSPSAYDRASAHLARCSACSTEAAAQRQARSAVRGAGSPQVPAGLLRALESIPEETGLPGQPDELAVTEDGQLVTAERRDRSTKATATAGAREEAPDTRADSSSTGRRARQGAGIMVSGLVLGALAFMNIPSADDIQSPENPAPLPMPGGGYVNNAANNALLPTSPTITAPPDPARAHPLIAGSSSPVPPFTGPPAPPSAMLAGSQPQH